ncbi:MAG: transcription antitermination factor NusB [Pseudomonadota bacterium]
MTRAARGASRSKRSDATSATPGLAARLGAVASVAAVLDRGRIPDAAAQAGEPKERAEARALADLTFRHLAEIDAVLADRIPRMPRPPVSHILRVMAAELIYRPGGAHAAVDLAVRQTKGAGATKLAGLVNAVGRKIATEPTPPTLAPLKRLPGWMADRLVADWGRAKAAAITEAQRPVPPTDLTLRDPSAAEEFSALLGAETLPTGGLRLAERPQISALLGFEDGAWWVQDAAASLPATLVPEPETKRVLDLCAAPGGKTLQLAAAGAFVTALDISAERMARLEENLARTRLTAQTVVSDALDWRPNAPFDAILLDAPCSATGTMRRHPDLPHRSKPAALKDLLALQRRLLERAWDWLRPGGVLVYATCSLLRAEGEDQAAAFRARSGAAPLATPTTGPFATAEGDIRTRPDMWAERGGLDGFFAARFLKPA